MVITLYQNSSPKNYVRKKLSIISTVEGTLRTETSITDPVVVFQFNTNTTPGSINYAYINSFHRFYYINDWVQISRDYWECTMHVDVLMTYWPRGLSSSPCILSRSSSSKQYDLTDPQMLFTADTLYGVQKFPNTPFSSTPAAPYVLILAGTD